MSGPSGRWSPDEDALLHELPHAAQVLYLRGLRRFVDDGGVVGLVRRVSERSLIETLVVPSRRGRRDAFTVAPTRKAIRSMLDALESAGLAIAAPDIGPFVFRLPYALQDKSVRRMRGQIKGPMRGHDFESDFNDLDPMKGQIKGPMRGPQQESIQVGSTSPACRSTQHAHASEVGELCRRLRHEAGMLDAHPGRQELVEALGEGFTIAAFVSTAINLDARKRNVGYLVARLRGQRADATHDRTSIHASSGGHRPSVCDLIEQQDAEHTARERGGLHVITGGRE